MKSDLNGSSLRAVWARAARRAAQPRLLALWLLVLALPTLFLTVPLMVMLAPELNYSPLAETLASKMSTLAMVDLLNSPTISITALSAVFTVAALAMLLVSSWLNALALGATRAYGVASFRVLIANANAAYWPMVRMGLFGFVPVGVVLFVASLLSDAIAHVDESAITESSVDNLHIAARIVVLILYFLAQCSIEAGRAVLVAHPRQKSVVKAWLAGLRISRRVPVRVLGTWLILTLPVVILVAALMVLRANLDQGNALGSIGALLLAEGAVLALAWMRCSRLFAMVDVLTLTTLAR